MKKVGLLVVGMLAAWAVTVVPGYLAWGEEAWLHSGVALALCLLPAVGTMAWVAATKATPEQQLMAILGGSGIRLAVTVGGAFLLTQTLPNEFPKLFWAWVGLYYLVALTLEAALVARKHASEGST